MKLSGKIAAGIIALIALATAAFCVCGCSAQPETDSQASQEIIEEINPDSGMQDDGFGSEVPM